MNSEFKFVPFVTTVAACCVMAFCWGMYCESNELSETIRSIVSFCIGFFGSKIIYNWLVSKDTPEVKSEEPQE